MTTKQHIIAGISIVAIIITAGFSGYAIMSLPSKVDTDNFQGTPDVAPEKIQISGTACSNIFEDPNMTDIPLPVNCSVSLGVGEVVNLNYSVKDDNGMLSLKSLNGPEVSLPETDPDYPASAYDDAGNATGFTSLRAGTIEFIDLNFDGYLDLRRLTGMGAYNFTYDFYIYDPVTHAFNATPALTDLVNPSIDPSTKTIRTFNKGRGIGDIFISELYELQGGKFVMVETVSQDLVNFMKDDSDYIYIRSRLIDGKMTVVEKKTITREEMMEGPGF